ADAALGGEHLEGAQLAVKEELAELVLADGAGQLAAGGGEGLGPALHQRGRPLLPALAAPALLERHEQGLVVQPRRLRLAKRLERRTQRGGGAVAEVLPRPRRQAALEREGLAVIDGVLGQPGALEVLAADQAVLGEALGADEQRVAGEGGEGGVGRV